MRYINENKKREEKNRERGKKRIGKIQAGEKVVQNKRKLHLVRER